MRTVVLGLTVVISRSNSVEYVSIGCPEPAPEGAVRWISFSESPAVGLSERPWAQEVETMPTVTCPSCGERGKIGASFIGSRTQVQEMRFELSGVGPCRQADGRDHTGRSRVRHRDARGHRGRGARRVLMDAVDGGGSRSEGRGHRGARSPAESGSAFIATEGLPASPREYKLLTSRDKYFEGKFDLPRLEEALNHYGRKGWTVKAMSTPHLKGFSGALEETIVVLLER